MSQFNLKLLLKYTKHTCNIFISTTPSEEWSVPTNLACVTASAMSSTVAGTLGWVGSERVEQTVLRIDWTSSEEHMYRDK